MPIARHLAGRRGALKEGVLVQGTSFVPNEPGRAGTAAILVATVQDTFGTALPLTFKNLTVTLAAFRRQVAV